MPENFHLGGGARETTIGIVAALLLVAALCLMLSLPKKYALIPMLLATLLMPMGNVVVLGGVHFMPIRIISMLGCLRLAWASLLGVGSLRGRLNSIDSAFTGSVLFRVLAFVVLWGSSAAVVNQIGYVFSTIGTYFLFRYFIEDEDDVLRATKTLAVVAVWNCIGMLYEQFWCQNLFGTIIGGVDIIPAVREGKIRSQGAFQHAILAGSFGATMFPLFLILLKSGKSRILAPIALVSCVVIVYTSRSSTPVLAFACAIFALLLWPIRRRMRLVCWGAVVSLVFLHLVMKAPVWFLIARLDVIGSSSGYHRAELVNQFITHISDWWFLGTKDNSNWGWFMFDTSNMYVSQGQSGGLLAFICFIAVLSRAFGRIGKAGRVIAGQIQSEATLWCLGSVVFTHVVAFFGISYWDQMEVAWFASLAMVSAYTAAVLKDGVRVESSRSDSQIHEWWSPHATPILSGPDGSHG